MRGHKFITNKMHHQERRVWHNREIFENDSENLPSYADCVILIVKMFIDISYPI